MKQIALYFAYTTDENGIYHSFLPVIPGKEKNFFGVDGIVTNLANNLGVSVDNPNFNWDVVPLNIQD